MVVFHRLIIRRSDRFALEDERQFARNGEHHKERNNPHANVLDTSLRKYSHDENRQTRFDYHGDEQVRAQRDIDNLDLAR